MEFVLAIETSCDDTGVAVLCGNRVLSNVVSSQLMHTSYGGVVPEVASRQHLKNIVPVVSLALEKANIPLSKVDVIGVTQGPGLAGSLMVGINFAKGLAVALNKPLVGVNHVEAHVLAHLIEREGSSMPSFPFLCLSASGGHTHLFLVASAANIRQLGTTLDDAAGEAFDKGAKMMGLPYPGGPVIDKLAKLGNEDMYAFPVAEIKGYDFSFSGLKTSLLYFLRDKLSENPEFLEKEIHNVCASYQKAIIQSLVNKVRKASKALGIKQICISGGVAANSALRKKLEELSQKEDWQLYIPPFEYCTDNAAMIGISALLKFKEGMVADLSLTHAPVMKK